MRRVQLVVHLTPETLAGLDPAVTITTGHSAALRAMFADAVAAWCGRPGTGITVQPLIDLNQTLATENYRPTAALRRHLDLRDETCRFPHCGQPAKTADADHVIPHARGGPTSTETMADLCRHHHRLKTHAGYIPHLVEPGTLHWRTPHGFEYLVTPHGTRLLAAPAAPAASAAA